MTVSEAARSKAARIKPATLEQEVLRLLKRHGKHGERVLLLRADPVWSGLPAFTLGPYAIRVEACVSRLAVLEQVTRHVAADDDTFLVLLTDREDTDLGSGILSNVLRQKVFDVEPWRLIEDKFGVQRVDPRLAADAWIAEALVDAMPDNAPRMAGTVLSRDVALRHLALRRLGLQDRLAAEDLDAAALIRWSAEPSLVANFLTLRQVEREGLSAWLAESTGPAGRVLLAYLANRSVVEGPERAGGPEAMALGLVSQVLWAPAAGDDTERARGGIMYRFDLGDLSDTDIRTYAAAAAKTVGELLEAGSGTDDHLAHAVLERAEALLALLNARDAAQYSDIIRSGFEHRMGTVANRLESTLDALGSPQPGGEPFIALAEAVAALRRHRWARVHDHRAVQAEMAQRLVQWLRADPADPASVSDVGTGIHQHMDAWAWVDRAVGHVWTGEDVNAELKQAYRRLYQEVRARRSALDHAFADRLATWTSAGSHPGSMLTVERVLPEVLAPLVAGPKDRRRPCLFLVLDGMSGAVATELAEQLRERRWEEYDPWGEGSTPRRRAVVAALPTLTKYSRASLFAAALTEGGQEDERRAFDAHPFWKGRRVRLFHKGGVLGDAGESLGAELEEALNDTDTAVAIVLNTIDDALDKGRERADSSWRIADIGVLRTVLDHAFYLGRAVVVTSDHGHVLDRGAVHRPVSDSASARHRTGESGPAGAGEVTLAGPRVAARGQQVVALWDEQARYTAKHAGYHGGVSSAEVAIPLMAFLPLGAGVPAGWSWLEDQKPSWWSLNAPESTVERRPVPSGKPARRSRTKDADEQQMTLIEVASAPADHTADGTAEVVSDSAAATAAALLKSPVLAAQRELMSSRAVPLDQVEAAVTALLRAQGNLLPAAVLAERAGVRAARAGGFAITLQRLLNVENYSVVTVEDGGRTVRLDVARLRIQFGLGKGTGT
ncbi:BREX-2 system phosphatase PglZ [Uniformispora flossi]|uniref:BREX-2 system phosphatase PglZ n=1 Tax=Uniformispora flossi TaxID=3390723 RepID=UPI003C2CD6E8